METYQTRLEKARVRLAKQEYLVAVLKQAIDELKKEGQPTDLEEKVLELLERSLRAIRADLAKLAN